jgi:hypothetical protein
MKAKTKTTATPKSAAKLKTDDQAILAAYQKGAGLAELKEKFGVKSKAHLAKILMESMIASGKLPSLKKKVVKAVPKEFTVMVNKRGTIVLPKDAVIDAFKMQVGQKLVVRKRGTSIILTT